jgi:hypothetical protein
MGKRAPRPIKRGTTWATVKRWALALPGVEEGTSHGMPSLLAFGKFLTRKRFEAEGGVVLRVGTMVERDWLLTHEPDAFFVTDHYKNYPCVLARLEWADPITIRELLEASWKRMAPRKLLKEMASRE